MNEAFMKPGEPVAFEGVNFRRAYRERVAGQLYLIQFEVTKEFWDACEVIPREGIVVGAMSWIEEHAQLEPEKPANGRKPKGIWGQFWKKMFAYGTTSQPPTEFFNHPDLHTVLNLTAPVTSEVAKGALREAFDVDSLTFVSPSQFAEWCTENELHSLATLANKIAFQ